MQVLCARRAQVPATEARWGGGNVKHGGSVRFSPLPVGLLVAAAGACAGAVYVPPPLTSASCAVPGYGSATAPWRQIHASGFTFCIPGTWRPSSGAARGLDANVWSGPGGAVSWSSTGPLPRIVTRDCVTIRNARTWQAMGPTTCTTTSNPAPQCSAATKRSEDVNGLTIEVAEADCEGLHITTATAPGIYLRAAADEKDVATLELAMFVTIRAAH